MAKHNFVGKLVKSIEQKKAKEQAEAFQNGDWRTKLKARVKATSSEPTGPDPFLKALRSVMRTANCLLNSEEGKKERMLKCIYADGKTSNQLNDDKIVLSPDVISRETTLKPEWSFDERVEVLGADALILSTLKRTATTSAQNKVSKNKIASKVWYTLETLNAEREILSEFPGAAEDFASLRSYFSDPKASSMIESRIAMAKAMDKPDLEGALTALQWELTYPDQPLNLPADYRNALDWAKEQIYNDCETSMHRADTALGVEEEFKKRFPQEGKKDEGDGDDSDSSDEGEGGGGGGSSGESKDEEDEKEKKDKGESKKDEEKDEEGEGEDSKDKDEPKGSKGDSGESKLPKLPNIGQARETLEEGVKNESNPEASKYEVDSESAKDDTPTAKLLSQDANDWKGGSEEKFPSNPAFLAAYRKISAQVNAKSKSLRNKIKIQHEDHVMMHHGLKSGILDEGSLHKIGIDRKEETLFALKEVPAKPKLAFGILIDESGSMASNGRDKQAREIAITLANAVKDYDGLDLSVMGHTTSADMKLQMTHYYTPQHKQIDAMTGICAKMENLDGYAMRFMAVKMAQWYPDHAKRCLFVISDGLPQAPSYGGPSAQRHMLEICYRARKQWGVEIFGIGIDNAFSHEDGCAMYGNGKFVVLKDTASAALVIGQYITKVVKKANILK